MIVTEEISTCPDMSAEFVISPEGISPPRVNKYEFKVNSTLGVIEAQVDSIASIIGASIKAADGKYTPLQNKKLKVLLNTSLGFIGSSVLYTEALLPIIGVLGMITSLVIGIGVFATYYALYDLDSAKARDSLSKKIITWDFDKIANTFTSDQVIRYDLLRNKLGLFNERQKARVYANISNLYVDKILLDKTQVKVLDTISKIYHTGIEALRKYYPPRTIYVNGTFINMYDSKYYEINRLWSAWDRKEKVNVKEAYDNVIKQLNANYTKFFELKHVLN